MMGIEVKICRFWRERCREEELLSNGVRSRQLQNQESNNLNWKELWKTNKSIQKFIQQEENTIKNQIQKMNKINDISVLEELSSLYSQLGTICELKENYSEALINYRQSVDHLQQIDPCPNIDTYRQYLANYGRLELQESLKVLNLKRIKVPTQCLTIDRREYGSISYSQFLDQYSIPAIPLIFTSSGPFILPSFYSPPLQTSDSFSWNLESIMTTLGHHLITPRQHVKTSLRWAKQEDSTPCQLQTILAASFPTIFPNYEVPSDRAMNYLVDWSLPQYCRDLFEPLNDFHDDLNDLNDDDKDDNSVGLDDPTTLPPHSPHTPIFNFPKYFGFDVLQLCPEGSLYKDTWPSLFIGPKDSKSSLHVDTFGSNFWMFLIHGRKKWRFYSPTDLCALSPSFPNSFEPVFPFSEKDGDEDEEAEIERMGICYYEVILHPGELIFVPAGTPHSVVNLEGTVAISCNYIDESNLMKCLDVLDKDGLTCSRSRELKENLERVCQIKSESNLPLKELPFWVERREQGDSISFVSWRDYKYPHSSNKGMRTRKRKFKDTEPGVEGREKTHK